MSYRDLRIWQLARDLSIEIHRMTLNALPAFEQYEVGRQIRRSSKSVRSNIVEGYGRRIYKQEFLRFLIFSQASCDETTDRLETLRETGSLKDEDLYTSLHRRLNKLGRSLNQFHQSVQAKHMSVRKDPAPYPVLGDTCDESV